jgi:hypothetical protein
MHQHAGIPHAQEPQQHFAAAGGNLDLAIQPAVHDGTSAPNADVAAGSIQYDVHPLDSAPSPLLRALPAYEREFRGHLRRAQALQTVGAARLAAAEQLIAEMVGAGTASCLCMWGM